MPIQDLTPQLRTRLSRVERAVGWFVMLAVALLLAGFGYYVYSLAQRKGWFLTKIPYHTYVRDATGLKPGDTVRLMGFDVGQILQVEGTEAGKNWFTANNYDVFVKFEINEPYYGYLWSDSQVRIATGDLLGKRILEVTKGSTGEVTVIEGKPIMVRNKDREEFDYVPLETQPEGYWLYAAEAPALTERFDRLANQVQNALPSFLQLTNRIATVLDNSATLTRHLDETTLQVQPILDNANAIMARLNSGPGALGEWLLPPDVKDQLQLTLSSATTTMQGANETLTNVDTNLVMLANNLNSSLINLANITSNLNEQVQANDQMLRQISDAVVHADQFIQGLKRHWLLRSAFKGEKRK